MSSHLYECLGWGGPVTHRQHRTWVRFKELEMNVPDRSDYYLAQVAYEVCRGNVKNPGSLKPDQFALKFRDPKRERAEGKYKRQSDHQLVLSKQVWMGRVANSGPRPGKKSSRGKDGSKKSAQGKKFKVEMPMPAKMEDY